MYLWKTWKAHTCASRSNSTPADRTWPFRCTRGTRDITLSSLLLLTNLKTKKEERTKILCTLLSRRQFKKSKNSERTTTTRSSTTTSRRSQFSSKTHSKEMDLMATLTTGLLRILSKILKSPAFQESSCLLRSAWIPRPSLTLFL